MSRSRLIIHFVIILRTDRSYKVTVAYFSYIYHPKHVIAEIYFSYTTARAFDVATQSDILQYILLNTEVLILDGVLATTHPSLTTSPPPIPPAKVSTNCFKSPLKYSYQPFTSLYNHEKANK